MTLLNTLTNLAGTCSGTLALWMVDNVSFKDCEGVTDVSLDCDTMQELQASGGERGGGGGGGENVKLFDQRSFAAFRYAKLDSCGFIDPLYIQCPPVHTQVYTYTSQHNYVYSGTSLTRTP